MYLPFEPPFSSPSLWANERVMRVVGDLLGPDFECIYLASDTPMAGSDYQPTHQDCDPLFPEWGERVPPYCVIMNVPLVDVGESDGPLEWFAGTERPEASDLPRQYLCRAGDVLLRDPRLWHRGSPNARGESRPTLAIIYARNWYRYHLNRPTMSREVFEELPAKGKQLFKGANIIPPLQPATADVPVTFD